MARKSSEVVRQAVIASYQARIGENPENPHEASEMADMLLREFEAEQREAVTADLRPKLLKQAKADAAEQDAHHNNVLAASLFVQGLVLAALVSLLSNEITGILEHQWARPRDPALGVGFFVLLVVLIVAVSYVGLGVTTLSRALPRTKK